MIKGGDPQESQLHATIGVNSWQSGSIILKKGYYPNLLWKTDRSTESNKYVETYSDGFHYST